MKVLVTGGNGYVGSVLLPKLVENDIAVSNIDVQWFGNFLPDNFNKLTKTKTIDQINESDLKDIDHVIHLANVANDPSVELNQSFSWEINTLHLAKLLDICKTESNIKSFIYASSGSVYGFSDAEKVTEEIPLIPISAYNKTKQIAERVCLSYQEHFNVQIIRPATVCGISPRMRFDVVVNMFVLQAYQKSKITILGGEQIRPNIHINDMAAVYIHFLNNPDLPSGFYNAGFENLSINKIAERISSVTKCELETLPSNDPRSYRLDSTKLLQTGFKPSFSVNDAIYEVYHALNDNEIMDNPRFHTVSWMKSKSIGIEK
jgi:nucleoside-diphosphate-sugar epimerase